MTPLPPKQTLRSTRPRLAGLLLLFALLATVYSLVTPIFEGPDEIWHYAFASHLADGGGLPILSAENPNLLLRNAAHPPLYYLPVAALIAPINRHDFPEKFRFNLASPHITPGSVSDRPNLLIHTRHEDWPYRQSVLAVHLGRLVSVALGVLTVWGVYEGARRLLPGRRQLPYYAALMAALTPQFVYGAGVINNDALAAAAGAWLLVALLGLMDTLSARWAVGAGLVMGVGLLSKIGMVAMLPLPAVALGLASINHQDGLRSNVTVDRQRLWAAIRAGLIVYATAGLVAGWWYLRNWLLYGDPLAWREWQALAGVGRSDLSVAQFAKDMVGLFGTFWADFGMRADRMFVWFAGAVCLVAGVGLALRWRRRDWPRVNWAGLLLAGLWLGLLLASAVRYALVITDIHGRLLYPALTVVCVTIVLGLTAPMPTVLWAARYMGIFFLFLLAPLQAPLLIGEAFKRPAVAGDLPEGVQAADATFGDVVALAGYELPEQRVEPGGAVPVVTYWRLPQSAAVSADAYAVLALVQPDGTVLGRSEYLLGSSVYPTSAWVPGDLIRLEALVRVERAVEPPVAAAVWLGVRTGGDTLLPGPTGEVFVLGQAAIATTALCDVPPGAGVDFGKVIRLTGWRVTSDGVTLCWRALDRMERDYTVFVHVLDDAGGLVASGDSQPRGGLFPTSAWPIGQLVQDHHPVPVPAGARVEVGLYYLETGERLEAEGGGTVVVLGP